MLAPSSSSSLVDAVVNRPVFCPVITVSVLFNLGEERLVVVVGPCCGLHAVKDVAEDSAFPDNVVSPVQEDWIPDDGSLPETASARSLDGD